MTCTCVERRGIWIVEFPPTLTLTLATDPETTGGFSPPFETILCLPGWLGTTPALLVLSWRLLSGCPLLGLWL